MATVTPNLLLRKPDGADVVNVVADINDNMDKIDTFAGTPNIGFGFPSSVDLAMLNQGNSIVGANVAVYMRCRDGGTISKVTVQCMNSIGFISVAAYANAATGRLSFPGTRLATSGAVACPATGIANVSLGASIVFPAGGWLGFSCSDGTLQMLCHTLTLTALTGPMLNGVIYKQTAAHPLPAVPSALISPVTNLALVLIGTA